MATADQVKSLIKAHIEQDDERFKTITLQIAANEAMGMILLLVSLSSMQKKLVKEKRT